MIETEFIVNLYLQVDFTLHNHRAVVLNLFEVKEHLII